MNINIASIMSKAAAWSKTEEGKRRINEVIERYRKEGRKATVAGSRIVTDDMMAEAADKFISVLRSTASDYDLPESVMEHINGLDVGSITKRPDGGFEVPLFFSGDLHRDSLDNDLGYEGVDNIVALFNNGYHARNYVYGWWEGHKPTGESIARSDFTSDFAWVRSKKEREAFRFIQQAITEFNVNYGAKYGVTAVAGAAYE